MQTIIMSILTKQHMLGWYVLHKKSWKKNNFAFSDQVRIAAAFYIGKEKEYKLPLMFFLFPVFTAISMFSSEIFARVRRKKISPVQASNRNNTSSKNMIISNLIPFTRLNLIFAFDLVVNSIVKLFNPTQIGVPKLSIHGNVLLLLLVFSNSEARCHFKRKVAAWRGVDMVEVLELRQQPTQREQATSNLQQSNSQNVQLPNQIYP